MNWVHLNFFFAISPSRSITLADFVGNVRSLRQQYQSGVPVLVHCSAGVGRSGVFVLVDLLMAKVDCGDVS